MKIIGKRSLASMLKLWLDILYYIVVVAGVVFVALAAYYLLAPDPAVMEVEAPIQFRLDGDAFVIRAPALGVEQARIDDATGMLEFDIPVPTVVFLYFGLGAVMAAVVLIVLWHLRRLFASLVDGRPFTPENARRIAWIAYIVLGGEVLGSCVEYLTQYYVQTRFDTQGLTLHSGMSIDFSTIFAGFVLLVIAELFRIGAGLQKDNELTI